MNACINSTNCPRVANPACRTSSRLCVASSAACNSRRRVPRAVLMLSLISAICSLACRLCNSVLFSSCKNCARSGEPVASAVLPFCFSACGGAENDTLALAKSKENWRISAPLGRLSCRNTRSTGSVVSCRSSAQWRYQSIDSFKKATTFGFDGRSGAAGETWAERQTPRIARRVRLKEMRDVKMLGSRLHMDSRLSSARVTSM